MKTRISLGCLALAVVACANPRPAIDASIDTLSPIDAIAPRDGGGAGAAVCDQYIACTAAVTPAGLATIVDAYAAGGRCWTTLSSAECVRACATGLEGLTHLPGSDIAECALCNDAIPCADPATPACVEGACVACDDDTHCPGRACDRAQHVCVDCTSDAHCSGATPACDTAAQQCVTCTHDSHCPEATPACDVSAHRCTACSVDAQCPAATPHCTTATFSGEPRCVACEEDTDCTLAAPHCRNGRVLFEPRDFTCGPCSFDDDCPSGVCDAGGSCRPATCSDVPATCGSHVLGGATLECGTCDAGLTCTSVGGHGHACRRAEGSVCDSTMPDSCGPDMRCVWAAPPNPANAGWCMVDVAATGCDATCSYQFGMPGFGGARVLGYCETTTDYCGTRCAGASNCRATEICTAPDRVTTSPPFYCLPR